MARSFCRFTSFPFPPPFSCTCSKRIGPALSTLADSFSSLRSFRKFSQFAAVQRVRKDSVAIQIVDFGKLVELIFTVRKKLSSVSSHFSWSIIPFSYLLMNVALHTRFIISLLLIIFWYTSFKEIENNLYLYTKILIIVSCTMQMWVGRF